jgi:hypothetical protein
MFEIAGGIVIAVIALHVIGFLLVFALAIVGKMFEGVRNAMPRNRRAAYATYAPIYSYTENTGGFDVY